jgi:hypothetical protein
MKTSLSPEDIIDEKINMIKLFEELKLKYIENINLFNRLVKLNDRITLVFLNHMIKY